jgi:phage-related protein
VRDFVDRLSDKEAAAVFAAMRKVAREGLITARHLRGDLYEMRADADRKTFRLLFAQEARFVLLSLSGFLKKTQRTPAGELAVAEWRLADWRRRGRGGL